MLNSNSTKTNVFAELNTETAESNERLIDEVAELQKRNAELKGKWVHQQRINGELINLLRNIIRVTYGEGWNYNLDWKVKAEKFLEEVNYDNEKRLGKDYRRHKNSV